MANCQMSTPFAVGICEDCLVAGRRSWLSIRHEVAEEKQELENRLNNSLDLEVRKLVEEKLRQVNFRLQKIDTYGRIPERTEFIPWDQLKTENEYREFVIGKLFYIPYCYADKPRIEVDRGIFKTLFGKSKEWLNVHIPYGNQTSTFSGKREYRANMAYWRISTLARPQLDLIDELISG